MGEVKECWIKEIFILYVKEFRFFIFVMGNFVVV